MAAMKLAFFIFFSLSTLFGAYHARHLNGIQLVNLTPEVLQMVTGEEEAQPPPLPPLEGRPSPRRPPSTGETIYGGDNPKSLPSQGQIVYGGGSLEGRPSPRRPPSAGETIYGGDNPNLKAPSQDQTGYSRDNPNAPPPLKVAPSRGQTTYGGDNQNSNGPTLLGGAGVVKKWLADFLALLIPTLYGQDYMNAQPSPKGKGIEGEVVYGQDNPKASPSPSSLKPDTSMDQTAYPTTLNSNAPHNQGMYGS